MFVRIACCFVKAAMSVFTLFTYTYTYTFIYIYIYLYICVLTGRLPLVREAHICSWVAGWLESGLASVSFFSLLVFFRWCPQALRPRLENQAALKQASPSFWVSPKRVRS